MTSKAIDTSRSHVIAYLKEVDAVLKRFVATGHVEELPACVKVVSECTAVVK
jgi:hypothetical protein